MENGPRPVTEDDVDREANEECVYLRRALDDERFPRPKLVSADQPAHPVERCAGPTDAVGKDNLASLVYEVFGHVD